MVLCGSILHCLSENTTTSRGSCILQQTHESGDRNERGNDGGCYLSDLKAAGGGRSALELCAPLPSEKGALHLVCT